MTGGEPMQQSWTDRAFCKLQVPGVDEGVAGNTQLMRIASQQKIDAVLLQGARRIWLSCRPKMNAGRSKSLVKQHLIEEKKICTH